MVNANDPTPVTGLSMKAKLAKWRAQNTAPNARSHVPEETILRDVVFVLQGIDGSYVRFHDKQPSGTRRRRGLPVHPLEQESLEELALGSLLFIENDKQYVATSTKHLLTRLSELGWLYRQIRRGIEAKLASPSAGLVELALCRCLQEELREYDDLVATLESKRASITHTDDTQAMIRAANPDAYAIGDASVGLTLHRLVLWTEDYRGKMQMMGILIDASFTARGGALLSFIHGYTGHGDPFIRNFTSSLLEKVSLPFFNSLAAWIYEGELADHSDEFFVVRNMQGTENGINKQEAWSGRYTMRKEMIPSFLSDDFGQKIFSTGRSLNYIKYACADGAWVAAQQRANAASGDRGNRLAYADVNGLARSIDTAYATASRRLFEIFFDKFGLLQHLRAIKDYLLLGRGDFFETLIEQLGPQLNKPANSLYRYHLTSVLESALRTTASSSDDTDTLGRLDARMLEYSSGEIGWDVFTLEYKVDAPVDIVLDDGSMDIYFRLFTHLWQIKRVDYSLNEVWKRVMSEARWYNRVTDLQPDFHQVRIILSEMIHFIRQLQYFSHLEVIDCSWTVLEEFALRKQGDLDGLIEAHQLYLGRLASKALLRGSTTAKSDDKILSHVREAFKVILQFKETVEALCNYALAEASRMDDLTTHGDGSDTKVAKQNQRPDSALSARTTASSRSTTPMPSTPVISSFAAPPPNLEQLAQLRRRIDRYAAQFAEEIMTVVTALAKHSDLDLRFLSCRLNFSFYYLEGRKDREKK